MGWCVEALGDFEPEPHEILRSCWSPECRLREYAGVHPWNWETTLNVLVYCLVLLAKFVELSRELYSTVRTMTQYVRFVTSSNPDLVVSFCRSPRGQQPSALAISTSLLRAGNTVPFAQRVVNDA